MSKVWTIGEALIDFVALEPGARVGDVSRFERAPGGAPANVAAGVARLGGEAGFIGKVGADEFGRFLRETLAAGGVDVSQTHMTTAAKTGLAFVSLGHNGERDFLFYRNPGADMLLGPGDLNLGSLTGAILHFGSISLIQEPCRSAVTRAVKGARDRGGFISYDPNLRMPLWGSAEAARTAILESLPWADFVKVSDEELEFLVGDLSLEAGTEKLLAMGPRIVAVTLSERGAYLANRQGGIHVAGFPVQAVDTTGAGDGFTAGFLYQFQEVMRTGSHPTLLDLDQLAEIGRFANSVGALVTTQRGGISAMPDRSRVEALLR